MNPLNRPNAIEQFDDGNTIRGVFENSLAAAREQLGSLCTAGAAANGAGLITLASYLASKNEIDLVAFWLIVASAVAFLSGLVVSAAAMRASYFASVAQVVLYSQKIQDRHFNEHFAPHLEVDEAQRLRGIRQENANNTNRWSKSLGDLTPAILSWSFRLFAFASLVALAAVASETYGRTKESLSNNGRCLAIQKDMLAARPRRTEAPDLFQALGCKPQGGGNVYAPPLLAGITPGARAPR